MEYKFEKCRYLQSSTNCTSKYYDVIKALTHFVYMSTNVKYYNFKRLFR